MGRFRIMPDKLPFVVLKFGGSSVSSKKNWERIYTIVKKRVETGHTVCMVHSALAGVSDLLQKLIEAGSPDEAGKILQEIKGRHIQLGESLELNSVILLEDSFTELEQLAKGVALVGEASYRVQARILAQGELMATMLGAAYLNQRGIDICWRDARHLLQSKLQKHVSEQRAFLNAESDIEPDEALQSTFKSLKPVVLTQGFIGADAEGNTVLFGRGGSDVSAAYLAAKLQAERLEIWSDVPGMFSANPREIPSARLLKNLTYGEAQEIATNGATVLHPKSILPAQKHHIPIHLRCTHRSELDGTIISLEAPEEEGSVKAVALRRNIILVSMESVLMWQQVGFLADAFTVFKSFSLSVDLISTSESNVTVSLDSVTNSHFNDAREAFIEKLGQYCEVEIIEQVSAVSLLGRHIRTILHQLGGFFEVFREHKIYMVDQAPDDLNFTFVVDTNRADKLVKELHEKLITKSINWDVLGPSWVELMEYQTSEREVLPPWWKEKREKLLEIAKEKGSVYVYDANELQRNIKRVQSIEAVSHCFYSMKANANAGVLKQFYEAGLGFECVSIGEMERVFGLFPDITPERILFTPNFAPRNEYEKGFEAGALVTVDNIFPLQHWPELFEGREFFLRIDPGYGQGHHRHVKTGGIHSKFGIPRAEVAEVKKIINDIGAKVKGLHSHSGSGVKDELLWKETAEILHQTAQELGGVKILDLGGGFGIQEFEMQNKLDLDKVKETLSAFKNDHPACELWVEPGRFLTATAGVLLTTVTQLKGKGNVRYVGVETGMNSLIRPALYGSHHSIVNLSKSDEPAAQTVNIVGPICESADKLGIDRRFPESEEGDIILIANTGAYGYVMSSNYNLREPAAEFMID